MSGGEGGETGGGVGLLGEVGVQPDVAVVLGLVEARERVEERAGRERAVERVEGFALCYGSACGHGDVGEGGRTELEDGVSGVDRYVLLNACSQLVEMGC